MLGTRNQQNARNKNRIEDENVLKFLKKTQTEIFENKENINLDNILPNKNNNIRNKLNQRNLKNDPEFISLEKKAENLIFKNTNKVNNYTKKSKSKNPLNPPAYLIRKNSVFSFFLIHRFFEVKNIFLQKRLFSFS